MAKARPKSKDKKDTATHSATVTASASASGTRYSGVVAFVERLSPSRVVFTLCLLSLLAYANSLGGDFVFDDTDQVVTNHDIRSWNNIGRAFTTHVWAFRERPETLRLPVPPPYYRPVFTVLLTVEYQIFGLWPQGWHLVSLLLHILCSIGVYYVLLLISGRNVVAATSALLFAVHPIHVESVSWISGMTDPLFGVFFLWSFYFYLRYRRRDGRKHFVLSILLFVLAAFSKETSLSMVALVFAYELIESHCNEHPNRPPIAARLYGAARRALPFAGVALLYLMPRYAVLGGLTWKTGHTYEGPLIHSLYTLPSVLWAYASHLIWPVDLSVAYFTSFVTSPDSPRFILPAIPLAALVSLLIFYRNRVGREVWHAVALFIIPLLPVLDLRQLSVEYLVFDRYLYLSVAGWSYLIALGIVRLAGHEKSGANARSPAGRLAISSAVLVLMLVALTLGAARENRNWADAYALWSQAARVRPQFWAGHYNAGLALMDSKRYSEARDRLKRAAELAPAEPFVFNALGRASDALGDTEDAAANFKHAIEMDPTMFESFNNLGSIYFQTKNYTGAEKQFALALNLKPQAVAPRFNLGLCYERLGKNADAAREFERVIQEAPSESTNRLAYDVWIEAHYQLGLVYEKTGRAGDAMLMLQRALSLAKSQELADRVSEAINRIQTANK